VISDDTKYVSCKNQYKLCEISGSHGSNYENAGMLCHALLLKLADISDVLTASIIRVITHCPDDGGSKHL
jgi:hypothetical protein